MTVSDEERQSRPWFVYILKCRDGTLYTGISTDIYRRLREHNSGRGAKYTRSRCPSVILAWWPCRDLSSALKCELKIKSLRREDKEALIGRYNSGTDIFSVLLGENP